MNRNRILTAVVVAVLMAMVALAVTSYLMNAGRITKRPIEVVSVSLVPPYTPGGPTVSITLKNTGRVPITNLTTALTIPRAGPTNEPFIFHFNVNPSSPLFPNQSIAETLILIGGGFDSDQTYPLTVSGTLMDGTYFSYTFSVRISQP